MTDELLNDTLDELTEENEFKFIEDIYLEDILDIYSNINIHLMK